MTNVRPVLLAAFAVVTAWGCAHGPGVAPSGDELPLEKVVVYRNGVAYFERAGTVRSERVEFKVKPDHVGDFLATLSVVEEGGSSVRSASFPIRQGEPPESKTSGLLGPRLETVVLELDGEEHALRVGYVAEQPVWRPSYRLIFDETSKKPMLQAWGIVQNLSGEDWKNVNLTLVAGAPIAFQSTLAIPVTPERPVVLDSGELIGAVPRGENTLGQHPPPMVQPAPGAEQYGGEGAPEMEPPMSRPSTPGRAGKSPTRPAAPAPPPAPPMDQPSAPAMSSGPRNLALLASTQVQAGTTRYQLPGPVTVPNGSATMVLILSREVPGESVFMFAPDPGVPDSLRHPFRVARFTNSTAGLLERGPIAVIEAGAFLGQGLLEPLAAGGDATVPFALERGLAVDADRKHETQASRLARIEASQLTVERDQVLRTTYRIRNGQAEQARVVLRHPRAPQLRLHEAPEGTDDRVGQGNALVPAVVKAHQTAEVVVDERRGFDQVVDWMSPWADEAVKAYLADPRADPRAVQALKETWAIREALIDARQRKSKFESEHQILRAAADETRANLASLKRNPGARVDQLRGQLAVRLADLDKKHADLFQRITELSLEENELRIRFEDRIRQLSVDARKRSS